MKEKINRIYKKVTRQLYKDLKFFVRHWKTLTLRGVYYITSTVLMIATFIISNICYNKNTEIVEYLVDKGIEGTTFTIYGWLGFVLTILAMAQVCLIFYIHNRIRLLDGKRDLIDVFIMRTSH